MRTASYFCTFLWFLIFYPCKSYTQKIPVDWEEKIIEMTIKDMYREAISQLFSWQLEIKGTNQIKTEIKISQYLGDQYLWLSMLDSAAYFGQQTLTRGLKHLENTDTLVAKAYRILGAIAHRKKDYEKALSLHSLAYHIFMQSYNHNDLHPSLRFCHIDLSNTYWAINEVDKAIEHLNKAVEIELAQSIPKAFNLEQYHMALGKYNYAKGNYTTAVQHYRQALHFAEEMNKQESIAQANIGMGNVYSDLGKRDLAISYIKKGLEINRQYWGPNHFETLYTMNALGLALCFNGQYEEAQTFLSTAVRRNLAQQKPNLNNLRHSYHCMALNAYNRGDTEGAVTYFEKVLGIHTQLFPDGNETTYRLYGDLGSLLVDLDRGKSARTKKGLNCIQKALSLNCTGIDSLDLNQNPTRDCKHKQSAIFAMYYKINSLLICYNADTTQKEYLRLLTKAGKDALELLDIVRADFTGEQSKSVLQNQIQLMFENYLTGILYQLQHFSDPDPEYLNLALKVMEKNHAHLLENAVHAAQKRLYRDIPEQWQEQKGKLTQRKLFWESEIIRYDPEKQAREIKSAEDSIRVISVSLDSINSLNEGGYSSLLANTEKADLLSATDPSWLPKSYCLISYYWGEERLFIMLVSRDSSLLIHKYPGGSSRTASNIF